MNTLELQRLICDDETLNGGDVAVLLALTTYLPNVWPSVKQIAKRARLKEKSVRVILRRLDGGWISRHLQPGRPTLYTFNPPLERPGVSEGYTPDRPLVPQGHNPPLERPPEETRRREEEYTIQTDTEISAGSGRSGGGEGGGVSTKGDAGPGASGTTTDSTPAPLSPSQKLAAWAEVWTKALGPAAGPLPTLAKLRQTNPACTEAMFSATLADVAASVAEGQARNPLKLFLANLRNADPDQPAWTREQVLAIAEPTPLISPPDRRRPELRVVTVPPKAPPLDPDVKAARQAAMRKARLELFGGEEVTA